MTESNAISVVIPIYGSFDIKRALICIDSIKIQKGVETEIIVSEQGEKRRFPEIEGVIHIFTHHKPQETLSDFDPGEVRNIAILRSTKEFIYTIDADIVFPDSNFLKKALDALKKDPNKVFFRPFMRRLPLNNFEEFCSWYDSLGLEEALKKLIRNQEFLVKTSPEHREIKTFEKDSKEAKYRKTFTSLIEDYEKYVKEGRGSDNNLNFWPVYWNENRHCGSNLFRREQFFNVGGYCQKFIDLGCEDSDLQWKFRETYDLQFFPPELEVIHLDHTKGYLSPEMWALNEKTSSKRKEEGVSLAIEEDKKILEKEYKII